MRRALRVQPGGSNKVHGDGTLERTLIGHFSHLDVMMEGGQWLPALAMGS